MPRATAPQLSLAQALVWRLGRLGDRPWAIRADILVACGTVKLGRLPASTVDRIIHRLESRLKHLQQVDELRKAGN
jgi:hypothetical protein